MVIPQTEVTGMVEGREIYRQLLPPGVYILGRGAEADIRLISEKVSRRHAMLTLNYFDWRIEDFDSANGTRVGGQLVRDCAQIYPQQEVQIGDVRLGLRRLHEDETISSLSPQAAVVLQYLPKEMRGERKYQVKGVIAMGGMGVVLEAEDVATRRMVAMKTLLQTTSAEETARFIEEAQITAQLEHPNIVPIYEVNVNELDRPFYTMRLVRGESLKQVLQRLAGNETKTVEQYPLSRLLGVLLRVCAAIAYAHSKGVVHRDLKPENIMLGEFGEVVVIDWGLAKPVGQRAWGKASDAIQRTLVFSAMRDLPGGLETLDGTALGTPHFMSPEQASGTPQIVDARADIYTLGAILYNMLTLEPPVKGRTPEEILGKVAEGEITPPEIAAEGHALTHLPEGRLPADLVAVAMKAMSLKPDDRFATVLDFQATLCAGSVHLSPDCEML